MMKVIKTAPTWLVLIILISSCALLAKPLVPNLENRTLWIDESRTGFYYDYCIDRSIFGKCKEWKTDFYDFTIKEQRLKLKNMGFKLRVIKR